MIGKLPTDGEFRELDAATGLTYADLFAQRLKYFLSELLENALTHGRGRGFGGARVWTACQYYPATDRLALAVVDDGCGLLRSLANHSAVGADKNDLAAIRAAFKAGVSCNKEVGLFDDARNQGMGLTVCRDMALQAQGTIQAVSGNTLCVMPNVAGQEASEQIAGWEGTMVSLTALRKNLVSVPIGATLEHYTPPVKPRIRFE